MAEQLAIDFAAAVERARVPYARNSRRIARFKARVGACEVCGWSDPGGRTGLLHADHVVPVSCGGTDDESNLLVLCPNHHGIAHAVKFRYLPRGLAKNAGVWVHSGPRTKNALVDAIRHYETRGGSCVRHTEIHQLMNAIREDAHASRETAPEPVPQSEPAPQVPFRLSQHAPNRRGRTYFRSVRQAITGART